MSSSDSAFFCLSICAHTSHNKQVPCALQSISGNSVFLRAPESEEAVGWKFGFMQNDLVRCLELSAKVELPTFCQLCRLNPFLILVTTPLRENLPACFPG